MWEVVGSEVVILDTTSHTTHRLTGDLARSFLAAISGQPVSPREVSALQERGFLEPGPPVSRRTLMAGGVAGLGIGLTSLSMPAVAAATSGHLIPTLTAANIAPAAFRWNPTQAGIDVTATNQSELASGANGFAEGQRWRLTLADLEGSPAEAEAEVTQPPGEPLRLSFAFPLPTFDRPDSSTILQGTLLRLTPSPVLSEQFPIPVLASD